MEEINNSLNVNQTDQLEALRYKLKAKNHNFPREKSEQILENEMPGMRKAIPKEETQNKYGGASRRIEIEAIQKHGDCRKSSFLRDSGRGSLIEGRFAYTIKNKPIADGNKKTGAYMG